MDTEQNEGNDSSDDDGFAAGFAGTPTATPAAPEPEGQTEAAAPAVQPEYVQLTKAEWEAIQREQAELKSAREADRGQVFGKIGGIERQLSELAKAGVREVSPEDFAEMQAEYPDLAEMQVKGLNRILSKMAPTPAADTAVDERVQAAITPALRRIELREVTRLHPDWQQVVSTPEYGAWAATQPADVQQQLASSWDSDFIGQALTQFKAVRKPEPASTTTRKGRFEAAVTPRGTGGNAPAPSDDDDFAAGYKKYAAR